ncbi:MAG: hypothetical protein E7254_01575 [Lachnospiraceae bacterium]|nr:hypothetical protein [Lachnospiraceae bacterium]
MITIAYFDEETLFAERFSDYISGKPRLPFKIKRFTGSEELKRHFENDESDILLVSGKSFNSRMESFCVSHIIVLDEGEERSCEISHPQIYKYQSVDNIIREMLEIIAEVDSGIKKTSAVLKKRAQIIGVYSPVARSGKTSLAITMGQLLSKEHEVLYVNLEEFSGLSNILPDEHKSDLSDLLYYYKQSPQLISVKLQAVVRKYHGMDYIPPMTYHNDLRNVNSREWVELINAIAEENYDYIILDLSNMVSDVMSLLEFSDYIYTPVCNDRMSMAKLNEYEEFLFNSAREDILEKTNKIKLPLKELPAWDENFLEELMWGCMGEFVRKLLKEKEACMDGR